MCKTSYVTLQIPSALIASNLLVYTLKLHGKTRLENLSGTVVSDFQTRKMWPKFLVNFSWFQLISSSRLGMVSSNLQFSDALLSFASSGTGSAGVLLLLHSGSST